MLPCVKRFVTRQPLGAKKCHAQGPRKKFFHSASTTNDVSGLTDSYTWNSCDGRTKPRPVGCGNEVSHAQPKRRESRRHREKKSPAPRETAVLPRRSRADVQYTHAQHGEREEESGAGKKEEGLMRGRISQRLRIVETIGAP